MKTLIWNGLSFNQKKTVLYSQLMSTIPSRGCGINAHIRIHPMYLCVGFERLVILVSAHFFFIFFNSKKYYAIQQLKQKKVQIVCKADGEILRVVQVGGQRESKICFEVCSFLRQSALRSIRDCGIKYTCLAIQYVNKIKFHMLRSLRMWIVYIMKK